MTTTRELTKGEEPQNPRHKRRKSDKPQKWFKGLYKYVDSFSSLSKTHYWSFNCIFTYKVIHACTCATVSSSYKNRMRHSIVKILTISLNNFFSYSKLKKWFSQLFFYLFYIIVSFSFSSLNAMGWGAIRGRKLVHGISSPQRQLWR